MYEICKEIIDQDGNKIYSAVAWTDLRVYASRIADCLAAEDGCKYIVRIERKVDFCIRKENDTEQERQ